VVPEYCRRISEQGPIGFVALALCFGQRDNEEKRNDTGASAGEETQRSLASHGLPNWNFWEDLMSNI
jgi:hypothetical protein